jgi:hypothetical protein
MAALLSILAILLSVLAIFAYQWVTPFPQLGIKTLYHLRRIRFVVAVIAIGLALMTMWLNPSPEQWVVLFITLILTPLSGFNHARRFLVSLDTPNHLLADEAGLSADAPVLGLAVGDIVCAWPLEILVPHHIVNDNVSGKPLMAVW